MDDMESIPNINEIHSNLATLQEQNEETRKTDSIQKVLAYYWLTKSKDSIILANLQRYFDSLNTHSYLERFYTKTYFFMTLIKK